MAAIWQEQDGLKTTPGSTGDTGKSAIPTKEIMTVDPTTGGMKGTKIVQFSLIPPEFLWELAEHYGGNTPEFGGKYPRRNWEKGFEWSKSEDAVFRHFFKWKMGKRYDDEADGTGRHHLICACWHLICLFIYDIRKLGTNDIAPNLPQC